MNSRTENDIDQQIRDGHIPFTIGLTNYGHTCYVNSIIHCIQNLKSIAIVVRSTPFAIEMLHRNRRFIPFFNSFLKLISANYRLDHEEALEQPELMEFREAKLKNLLEHTFNNGFHINRQEDAHLFLTSLLHWLNEDIQVCAYVLLPELIQSVNYNEIEQATEALLKIINNMQIKFKQTIICPRGHSSSHEYDDILTLQLRGVGNRYFEDINQAIQYYFADTMFPHCSCSESTHLCNAFECTVCEEHVPARKVLKIIKLPEVLIIKFELGALDPSNQVSNFLQT